MPGTDVRVLIVDDDPLIVRSFSRAVGAQGASVVAASDGRAALDLLEARDAGRFDVVVCDIEMPRMNGLELLREVRKRDLNMPVILVTGSHDEAYRHEAHDLGVFDFLHKPLEAQRLTWLVRRAARLCRIARAKDDALETLDCPLPRAGDRAGLEGSLDRALDTAHLALQPIVRADGAIFAYECLLRSREPSLPHPGAILDAARRVGAFTRVGRRVRALAAEVVRALPEKTLLFVNVDVDDLSDPELFEPRAGLGPHAERVVIEITERQSLDGVEGASRRASELRSLGYRIAIDDLGAGYAGLGSFAELEPSFAKIDMSLVRAIDESPIKQKVVTRLARACHDLEVCVVAEGIETDGELDAVKHSGCDLLQGYRIGRPGARLESERVW
jgi:EAL domain-containing protein (putative c-di-GMP-specific phosphodiesterase class I)/ActR/RegA family two-component response regulator